MADPDEILWTSSRGHAVASRRGPRRASLMITRGAASSSMNAILSRGVLESMGRYAAPARRTASAATTNAAERSRQIAMRVSGSAPWPRRASARRPAWWSSSRYESATVPSATASASGVSAACDATAWDTKSEIMSLALYKPGARPKPRSSAAAPGKCLCKRETLGVRAGNGVRRPVQRIADFCLELGGDAEHRCLLERPADELDSQRQRTGDEDRK